jgi:hypothetical protein
MGEIPPIPERKIKEGVPTLIKELNARKFKHETIGTLNEGHFNPSFVHSIRGKDLETIAKETESKGVEEMLKKIAKMSPEMLQTVAHTGELKIQLRRISLK